MSALQRFAIAVCLVSLAIALVLTLTGCGGGGDPADGATYQPVNCGKPGACA